MRRRTTRSIADVVKRVVAFTDVSANLRTASVNELDPWDETNDIFKLFRPICSPITFYNWNTMLF